MRFLNTLRDRVWTDPLPIWAWLIEHPEGLIVIDTGETARASEPGYFPRWHPYFRLGVRSQVRAEEEIGPQLRALGHDPADVRWVVMTHLHTDHAGGLGHFPRSEILISSAEYEVAARRLGKFRGYLPHRWPDWLEPRLVDLPREPYGPFPESLAVTQAGNVRIIATRGHSPGHMSVVVEDGDRAIFLAGDTSYTEKLMLEEAIDGVAPDEAGARETLRRIHRYVSSSPTVYLPSHDPGSGKRLSERAVAA